MAKLKKTNNGELSRFALVHFIRFFLDLDADILILSREYAGEKRECAKRACARREGRRKRHVAPRSAPLGSSCFAREREARAACL